MDAPYTIPDTKTVTRDGIDEIGIDFTPALAEDESIASPSAVLWDQWADAALNGFVTNVTNVGNTVIVSWQGAGLALNRLYVLKTEAILNTGETVPLLTRILVAL